MNYVMRIRKQFVYFIKQMEIAVESSYSESKIYDVISARKMPKAIFPILIHAPFMLISFTTQRHSNYFQIVK